MSNNSLANYFKVGQVWIESFYNKEVVIVYVDRSTVKFDIIGRDRSIADLNCELDDGRVIYYHDGYDGTSLNMEEVDDWIVRTAKRFKPTTKYIVSKELEEIIDE